MTVTRANLESILIRRVGTWYTSAGLDGVTVDGTNEDLNDPLATALLELGHSVADITNVSSADLVSVPDTDIPRLLAVAELRALENAAQAFSTQEVSGLGYSIKTGSGVGDAIARLRSSILARYGLGGGSLTGGTLTLDFQDTT
jgi:hypothetical protein